MDGSEDIALHRRDLGMIGNHLYEAHDNVRRLEIRAGALAGRMVESGVRKSEIAKRLGVSQPHVNTLISRAGEQGGLHPVSDLIPLLSPGEVLEYLSESGRSARRVISGFSDSDVLFYSGLDPEFFDPSSEAGRRIEVPELILMVDSGRWIGVEGCNVGYGGTGPTNTRELLTGTGVDEELARRAHTCRFIDLDLEGDNHLPPIDRELYGLELPVNEGQVYAAHLGVEDLRGTVQWKREVEKWGFRGDWQKAPSVEEGKTAFERWIDFLDMDSLPEWLTGPRVGRLFISEEESLDHGFGYSNMRYVPHSRGPIYRLIIEQGRLQLWIPFHQPMDRTQILPEEVYTALGYASLYPDELAQLDERSRLARYLDTIIGRRQPRYVDVSREGNRALSYIPAQEPANRR